MSVRVQSIDCVEGQLFFPPATLHEAVRAAAIRLQHGLRPRLGGVVEQGGGFIVRGIVGAVDVGHGTVLNVTPKVEVGDDWIGAILRLLVGTDRVDAAGERFAGFSPHRRNLLDVLAAHYVARLEHALRRDGPILMLGRKAATRGYLKGKLRSGDWLRGGTLHPHRLPVEYNELTADHPISGGLAGVAELLARHTSQSAVRSRLLLAAAGLRPGHGTPPPLDPVVAHRNLPAQWAVYAPAWSIARAVLMQRSLLGAHGSHSGVSVAIEVWPLLERLLERCLAAAVRQGNTTGRALRLLPKRPSAFLTNPEGTAVGPHDVIPDATLEENGATLAVFDAKYRRRNNQWPDRSDIYQVTTAAAVCRAPLAVLVYPERFPVARWQVNTHAGFPQQLVAVGLGLFSCLTEADQMNRAQLLLSILPEEVVTAAGA